MGNKERGDLVQHCDDFYPAACPLFMLSPRPDCQISVFLRPPPCQPVTVQQGKSGHKCKRCNNIFKYFASEEAHVQKWTSLPKRGTVYVFIASASTFCDRQLISTFMQFKNATKSIKERTRRVMREEQRSKTTRRRHSKFNEKILSQHCKSENQN